MISFIQTFGLLVIIITIISFLVKLFKQPIIIGYVLSGLLFSYFLISKQGVAEQISIFSDIGIVFLLFLIGMELDLKSLKYLGKDVLITTLVQSIVFFTTAFGLASLFGFPIQERVYISILFMFSSTILVAKWVDDKHESTSLHGKIILSTLVLQDILAIIALTLISIAKESALHSILLVPLKGLALIGIAFLLAKIVLNPFLKFSSKYPELLFILSLSICFAFVELAPLLGYSTTIGAFIGGVVLANTAYRIEVYSRMKQLIVFFNMLFFVGLGFQMNLNLNLSLLIFVFLLCILSLFLKPIVIYLTLRARNYDLKTSFFSGLYLAQLSEFGIIIMLAGVSSGAIPEDATMIAIMSVILTMIFSSYFIKYDKKIFKLFEAKLAKLDKKLVSKDIKLEPLSVDCNILFFGYYDIGKELREKLQALNKKIVVVEKDPENMAMLRKEGIRAIYSSINDPAFFEHLNFEKVELVISSLLDPDENKLIIKHIKKNNPKALIIVSAKSLKEALDLYKNDADYVLYSSYLHEQRVSVILEEYSTDINKVVDKKIAELAKLQEKEEKLKSIRPGKGIIKQGFIDISAFMKRMERIEKERQSDPSNKSSSVHQEQSSLLQEDAQKHTQNKTKKSFWLFQKKQKKEDSNTNKEVQEK